MSVKTREQRLKEACQWHQRNDRNGEFDLMWAEYERGELDLEVVHEVCERVFIEIRDEHLPPEDPNEPIRPEIRREQDKMDRWIDYINEGNDE